MQSNLLAPLSSWSSADDGIPTGNCTVSPWNELKRFRTDGPEFSPVYLWNLQIFAVCSKRSSEGSSGSGTNESSNSWAPFIPRSPSARNSNLLKSPLVRRLDSPHEKYHKYSITIHKFKKAHKDPQGVNVDVYGFIMLHNVTHSYARAVLAVFKTRRVISVYWLIGIPWFPQWVTANMG